MDDIARLLHDESEIRRLVLTWMDGLDTRSFDRVRSCWTDEMETEYSGFPNMGSGPFVSGKHDTDQRYRKVIETVSEFDITRHSITNQLVEVKGDRATCSCYVLATHYLSVPNAESCSVIAARYDVDAVRLPTGWRLTKLKWTGQWTTGNDGLWLEVGKRIAARQQEGGRATA